MSNISLIVGLGNPGSEYAQTRHNAGFWFVERLADQYGINLKKDPKFNGFSGRGNIEGQDVRLLLPTTFMNLSGKSVVPFAKFYNIAPESILKTGGGHGGHNGLRDIVPHIGPNFHRLRIGIGHPGAKDRVSGHVLSKAPSSEQRLMDDAISHALARTKMLVNGEVQQAMNQINAYKPN